MISCNRWRVTSLFVAVVSVSLMGFGGADKARPVEDPIPVTVPKAICGPNDHPETGLQGQVSAALRASGFHGLNCNLELIGQSRGDGANWQTAEFSEGAHRICAYHGTSFSTANRTHLGVPVIDITDARNPSLGNLGFDIKRDALERSLLKLNREIADLPGWTENSIKVRAGRLADLATKIWPQIPTVPDAALSAQQS